MYCRLLFHFLIYINSILRRYKTAQTIYYKHLPFHKLQNKGLYDSTGILRIHTSIRRIAFCEPCLLCNDRHTQLYTSSSLSSSFLS